jgi:hypothetical protein
MRITAAAVVTILAVSACAGMTPDTKRWPGHRKIEEDRISKLEMQMSQIGELEKRIQELEAMIRELRAGPARSPVSPPITGER